MIIYIIHSDQIYTFKLSVKAEGKYILYDYDSNGNRRNLTSIEAVNNKWYIYENENIKINYNSQQVKSVELAFYNFYQLIVYSTDSVFLYVMPAYDQTFVQKKISDGTTVTIGNKGNADVVYNYQGISENQVKIDYNNGVYTFENLNKKVPIFVNRFRKDFGTLRNFDTIFIMGLKIIFCKDFILINNPANLTYSISNKFGAVEPSVIVGDCKVNSKSFSDFYEEKDYFNISPVFQNNIKAIEISVSPPPNKDKSDETPIIMTIVPSLLMSLTSVVMLFSSFKSYNNGESTKDDLMVNLIMVGSMLALSIIWPFIERFYSKFSVFRRNTKRSMAYTKYLKKKEKEIQDAIDEQKITLKSNYYSLDECQIMIKNRTSDLFSRSYENDDFLRLRLGIGNVELYGKVNFNVTDFAVDENSLEKKALKMIENNKYVSEVPFTVSLKDKNSLTFILSPNIFSNYISSILLQIVSLQSYIDLKIVVLTGKNNGNLDLLKDSNYCWSPDQSFRFYATTLEEGQSISSYLLKEFNNRESKKDSNLSDGPYYLIISDSINIYRNLDIIKSVIKNGKNVKMGLLMFDTKTTNIPKGCIDFVDVNSDKGSIFQTRMQAAAVKYFKPEFVDYKKVNVDECFSLINNIPMKYTIEGGGMLPDTLGFLEMFNVGNVEQLNSDIRWEQSDLINSLATPIGVDENGNILLLDLHEKSHGPHGLIAGMTGSGKSEFIVTYILSLAVNYRPDEVQFVLIDYKGGGLAGAFENRTTKIKLPHLVGTITNLDKSEMNRTLVSIKSELQRRQKMFNEAKEKLDTGNIDIYKYQRLYREKAIDKPLSHLFIICDEFAELKAQQPDFMDELVSAARIGRSLGIHLILATQKPSGVVDDQIWSNSKFKICCKVQTTEDSNEMIRRPDAAYLKEAGRFYLQVGYDEYFVEGQSAYSGVSYIPKKEVESRNDDAISFINNLGDVFKRAEDKKNKVEIKENLGEELTNVLKYIISVAEAKGYLYQQLWLDNVPHRIFYQNIINKYNIKTRPYVIDPVIGEYDDPENQKQGYVSMNLTARGNTFICGVTGSGKTTLLQTMIYGSLITHNSDELNIYIVDCGAEKLGIFADAPQVGDVLFLADTQKINYLFYKVISEITKRKKYFAQNHETFESCVASGKSPFPTMLIIINDNDVFKEQFSDLYDDLFVSIVRDCNKFGIIFVLTGSTTSSLGYNVDNSFSQKIVLKLADPSDYVLFFATHLVPSNNPGRGLIEINNGVYEFQSSLVFDEQNFTKNIKYVLDQLNKALLTKASPVPTIPEIASSKLFKSEVYSLSNFPVGVNLVTAQTVYYNFNQSSNFIYSNDYHLIFNFVSALVELLLNLSNTKIIMLNSQNEMNFDFKDKIKYYDSSFKQVMPVLSKNVEKYNNMESNQKFIILIFGLVKLEEHLKKLKEENGELDTLNDLIQRSHNNNFKFIICENSNMFSDMKKINFYDNCDHDRGIWIGKDFSSQRVFETDYYTDKSTKKNDGAVIVGDNAQLMRYIQKGE